MRFPGGSAGKESACNAGDLGSSPGLGRSPGEGKGYPLQCSGLENSIDYTVHGVAKSQTRLSDFHFFPFSSNPPRALGGGRYDNTLSPTFKNISFIMRLRRVSVTEGGVLSCSMKTLGCGLWALVP